MRSIAIYGKGGIGKSTCSANLSVSWRRMGLRVLQVGCDPKADSCSGLMHGEKIDTVLDLMQLSDRRIQLSDLVHESPSGVFCVEAGGPTPGIGCAGRGIISAFEKLEELNYKDELKPDIVLYDVLGDVVCGGFAMPIRNGYARDVYVGDVGEAGALGEVLADQPVGVLVGGTLPGAVGIGEVDRDTGDGGEGSVLGHLRALIPSDGGVDGPGQVGDHGLQGVGDGGRVVAGAQAADEHEPAGAFHQGDQSAAPASTDEYYEFLKSS